MYYYCIAIYAGAKTPLRRSQNDLRFRYWFICIFDTSLLCRSALATKRSAQNSCIFIALGQLIYAEHGMFAAESRVIYAEEMLPYTFNAFIIH